MNKLSPAHREAISRGLTGKTLSPEHRENIRGALKGRVFTDEHLANMSKANKGKPASPALLQHLNNLNSAQRGKPASASQRAGWLKSAEARRGIPLSEEHRAKVSAAQKGKPRTPAQLEQLNRLHDSWLKSPEGQDAAKRFFSSSGLWSSVGEDLRERDGDLCQLCLDVVDFELPLRTPMSRSVDHILPVRAGGSDELDNLWVAHVICNQRKGARYAGRLDGSTDIRRV